MYNVTSITRERSFIHLSIHPSIQPAKCIAHRCSGLHENHARACIPIRSIMTDHLSIRDWAAATTCISSRCNNFELYTRNNSFFVFIWPTTHTNKHTPTELRNGGAAGATAATAARTMPSSLSGLTAMPAMMRWCQHVGNYLPRSINLAKRVQTLARAFANASAWRAWRIGFLCLFWWVRAVIRNHIIVAGFGWLGYFSCIPLMVLTLFCVWVDCF